jgi:TonB-linked SusC/RagA family outer membrane protein
VLLVGALVAPAVAPAVVLAQTSTGVIGGRVTDQGTGQPVQAVQVQVVGTSLGALTNERGEFSVRGVRAGTVTVRALRIGYSEVTRSVTVVGGQTATANFALPRLALTLTPIVATATGEQRRLEVPNQIAQVDATKAIESAQVSTVSDLLTAKAAGVQLLPGSGVGAASRIRIRGQATLSLNNDPIIIMDGVRINSSDQGLGTGGAPSSRLNDINPEDIETIDILKGPAASATYGTDAATGVVVITTKRGRAGAARWNAYTEQGLTQDKNSYPLAYTAWGKLANQTNAANNGRAADCTILTIAAQTCVVDSITTFNLWNDPRATPLKDGRRQQYGLNLRGGAEAVTYFASLETERTTGVLTVPQFDRERLLRQGAQLRGEWLDPNTLRGSSLRANLDIRAGQNLQIPISSFFRDSRLRQPQDGNNTTGLGSHAFGGFGTRVRTLTPGGTDSLYGYRQFTPGDIFQEVSTQDVQRYVGSISPVWNAASWLQVRGNAGLDYSGQTLDNYCLRDECPNFGQNRLGFRSQTRSRFFQYTADANAQLNFRPFSWLATRTTPGIQFIHRLDDSTVASGSQLPPGGRTITQGSVPGSAEGTSVSKTAGVFVEQNLQFYDRLDIVGSVRGDQNSAFGRNFGTAWYPRLGASYQMHQEGWLPFRDQINTLRLRTSWGRAGVRPGTTAALQFFASNSYRTNAAEVPGLIYQALGNADLRPATLTEFEGGFDLGLWQDRFSASITRYDRESRDEIINVTLAPSLGTGATTRAANLGSLRNAGWEYLLTARPVALDRVSWDVTFNGSRNTPTVESLGNLPPIIGATQRTVEGYPPGGFWQRGYTYADGNGNGLIELAEVRLNDSVTFVGYRAPRTEISVQNGIDLFRSQFRLSALVDYKGDYRIINTTERFRCGTRLNARERIDPSAPLDRQARCAAFLLPGNNSTQAGYIEDGSFTRLREVAVTWRVPTSLLRRAKVQSGTVTIGGRNLALWSDYTGVDPETAGAGLGETQDEFQVTPPLRTWTVRFNFGF